VSQPGSGALAKASAILWRSLSAATRAGNCSRASGAMGVPLGDPISCWECSTGLCWRGAVGVGLVELPQAGRCDVSAAARPCS